MARRRAGASTPPSLSLSLPLSPSLSRRRGMPAGPRADASARGAGGSTAGGPRRWPSLSTARRDRVPPVATGVAAPRSCLLPPVCVCSCALRNPSFLCSSTPAASRAANGGAWPLPRRPDLAVLHPVLLPQILCPVIFPFAQVLVGYAASGPFSWCSMVATFLISDWGGGCRSQTGYQAMGVLLNVGPSSTATRAIEVNLLAFSEEFDLEHQYDKTIEDVDGLKAIPEYLMNYLQATFQM
ncbi:unnamed protein product [Miscanthus lutarioriparius]|uniref:Uncharacterized protein n=1 Tax=Miscanthus lutarioriparius TaxID=422564 RepID=A0A811RS79_9POAL|nr:unnamed protein product [Miscanthus lutarioriparius]